MSEEGKARNARLNEALDDGMAIDIYDEAMRTEGVAEMLKPLSPEDRKAVEENVRDLADGWQDVIDEAIVALQDEEVRKKFVEEAKKRYSHL